MYYQRIDKLQSFNEFKPDMNTIKIAREYIETKIRNYFDKDKNKEHLFIINIYIKYN